MKQNKIYWLIIAVLVLLLILQQQCRRCPELPETSSDTVTVIEYDSLPVITTVPKPVPYYVSLPPDTFFIPADTALLVARYRMLLTEYYTLRLYNDTLINDTTAFISLADSVLRNRLHSRELTYINRRPLAVTTIINQVGDIPRNKVFIGPVIGRSLNDPTIGGSILLVGKKKFAYSYTYDILNKDHYLGIYYKISLKTRQ